MKSIITIIIGLILFAVPVRTQDKLPVIKSNSENISIQDGETLYKNRWRLSPEKKPAVYTALLGDKPRKVTFITDVDQISFTVEDGKKYDFIIQWGDKLCYTQIVGLRMVPRAVFDEKYQASHRGKIFVEIPEVYELVNVAIALTQTGIDSKTLVYQRSDYYKRVRDWFDKYQSHPLITALDSSLKKGLNSYYYLKMNGYSFEFNNENKIVQSAVYDRTAFEGEDANSLRPFLSQLQSFADQTNFRKFYRENRQTYDEQIAFYRDVANVAEMKLWLDKNFPTSNDYDSYKIIFSPLVAHSQSSTWFKNNGFKELQPHVNFPYLEDFTKTELSEKGRNIARGEILFTEINHGYINPEAGKYSPKILKATGNRNYWVDGRADLYKGIGVFNEYMNWALISLFVVDHAPGDEQDKMIAAVDRTMTKGRGFLQFDQFDKFLVDLYRNRKQEQTIADLYPQIIEWFEKRNQESMSEK